MASRRGVVLALDTAGPVVGATVWVAGEDHPRGAWEERVVKGADAVLLPAVASLLEAVPALDLVAVSTGPGAFTGLRVGVATALGVAVARGVGVVACSSLLVRAAMVCAPRVLALLDARKGRVYGGLFDSSGEVPRPLEPELDVDPGELFARVAAGAPFVAVGEGAHVHRGGLQALGGVVAEAAAQSPAAAAARIVLAGLGQEQDPGEVALRYLRQGI